MSLTRKIAHNTLSQIIGKIISTLLGLVAIGLMTRYLGQEKFGWYITTIAFLQFVGILSDFGMTVVTAQMLSEPEYDKTKLFKNLFSFRFFSALIFFGIAPFAAIFFPYPMEVKIAIGFTSISYFATVINQVFIGLYQTRFKMHIQAAAEIISRIILVAGIWLLIQNNASFLPIMGVIVISSLAQTGVIWIKARRETVIAFAFDREIWVGMIKKMWPIAIAIIFNVVYLKGDLVLLSIFRAQSEVGIYGAAYRILDVITQSAMMIMGVLLPLLASSWSRKQKPEFKKYYQQSFDIMMLFAIPMMVGAIVMADKITRSIAGDEFIGSGKILAILSIAVFGVFLGAIFGHTAVAINKQKQTLWIYISDAFITLTGYLIFIPLYGIYGAAWMSVFSELYAGILLFVCVRRYAKEKLRFKTLFKIIFASFVMVLALLLTDSVPVLLSIFIGMLVYTVAILAIGGISKETIKEVLNIQK